MRGFDNSGGLSEALLIIHQVTIFKVNDKIYSGVKFVSWENDMLRNVCQLTRFC